ncbi:MAG: hypothetical protein IKO85_05220 [Bacteroidaceae bacterium]|nr:hypothetical protein [Bacteroidaceae bacterium]
MQFKESKFNLGDKVATVNTMKMQIVEFEVTGISVNATEQGQEVVLRSKDYMSYDESRCFASREELLAQLNRE